MKKLLFLSLFGLFSNNLHAQFEADYTSTHKLFDIFLYIYI